MNRIAIAVIFSVVSAIAGAAAGSERADAAGGKSEAPKSEAVLMAEQFGPETLLLIVKAQVVIDCSRELLAQGKPDGACVCYGEAVADEAAKHPGLLMLAWDTVNNRPLGDEPDHRLLSEISAMGAERCAVPRNPSLHPRESSARTVQG